MFDSTKEDLKEILKSIDKGKLQLPDFQRDYVWGDDDVRSLIASIARGFPIGALLTLETGGEVRFKPRLLAGVKVQDVEPVELLLDGQQRMTSLYQALHCDDPVRTRTQKGKEVDRHYYLDIGKTVSGGADIEDAIVGVPADRIVRSNFGRDIELDLSEPEHEYENNMFPLYSAFEHMDWYFNWREYWNARSTNTLELERGFFQGVLSRILHYKLPIIRLDRNNSRDAICLVFEKVNVGGKKLDAFELVTAIYAADEFDLREDWLGSTKPAKPGRRQRMIGKPNPRDVLKKIASTDFLQACTLLHTRDQRLAKVKEGLKDKELPQVTCKREALLALPLHGYRKHADSIERGFIEAASFLNEQKIIWRRDVPYPPQIVGLAATFAILGDEAQTASAKEKLAQWFWCVTLGELYGSSTESKLARDVTMLVDWIRSDGDRPQSIDDALFQQDRLRTLRIRISAAYKGLHALLMRSGCQDFISAKPVDIMTFFDDRIDIHHIFPRKWCKANGIDPKIFNSIVNKTALSKKSNILIGGDAPSVYLKRIEQKHRISSDKLDEILRSHLIEPEHLRNDDFEAFFEARIKELSGLVESAMGKPVVLEHGSDEVERDIEIDDDESLEESLETTEEFA